MPGLPSLNRIVSVWLTATKAPTCACWRRVTHLPRPQVQAAQFLEGRRPGPVGPGLLPS